MNCPYNGFSYLDSATPQSNYSCCWVSLRLTQPTKSAIASIIYLLKALRYCDRTLKIAILHYMLLILWEKLSARRLDKRVIHELPLPNIARWRCSKQIRHFCY
jgi:hypothetical protein